MYERKRILLAVVLAGVVVTAFGFLGFRDNSSIEYKNYQEYIGQLNGHWQMEQSTAESFARGSCRHLAEGGSPAFKIQSADQLKATAAVLAAYCPDAFRPFLGTVSTEHAEYANVALTIDHQLYWIS